MTGIVYKKIAIVKYNYMLPCEWECGLTTWLRSKVRDGQI
jgi:hypothetical protein